MLLVRSLIRELAIFKSGALEQSFLKNSHNDLQLIRIIAVQAKIYEISNKAVFS